MSPRHPALAGTRAHDGWLRDELAELREELAAIGQRLGTNEQERAAAARVVELADVLPDRLGAAIAAAIEIRQNSHLVDLNVVATRLASAVAQVAAAADALLAEAVRLRATGEEMTANAAQAIEAAATRAVRHLGELGPSLADAADAAAHTTI